MVYRSDSVSTFFERRKHWMKVAIDWCRARE